MDYRGYRQTEVVILELCEIVCRRVRLGGFVGRTVNLSLKDVEFFWLSRAHSVPCPTASANDIYRIAVALLHRHWPDWKPVSAGVFCSWPVPVTTARPAGSSIPKEKIINIHAAARHH